VGVFKIQTRLVGNAYQSRKRERERERERERDPEREEVLKKRRTL
jgi:hypothetical protein